jgi:hypothetical protein
MGALTFLPPVATPWNIDPVIIDAAMFHTARRHHKCTENSNATLTKTGGRQFMSLPSEHIVPEGMGRPEGGEQTIRPEANTREREVRGPKNEG